MSTPRPKPARTLGEVLTAAHDRAEKQRGKKISFGELSRHARDEHYVQATDETIRSYHNSPVSTAGYTYIDPGESAMALDLLPRLTA